MTQVAKLFKNGRSQAVRLPAAFRFEGSEVLIRRDEATGDVILSPQRRSLDRFFAALGEAQTPVDFLTAEDRRQGVEGRDPLAPRAK